ncbi:protein roadkill [Diachasma alloeum]|uniref:protein roadkill n=1 Tax=Diachasma alloeum TaxID=454923 RepID=UPI0007382173|nr:protein roadkill [Diachasma alloeum]
MTDCDEIYETKAKVIKHSFKWIIHDFSEIIDKPGSLQSRFSVPGYPLRGHLDLFPLSANGSIVSGINDVECLDLDIHAHIEDDAVHSDIEVSVVNSEGVKCMTTKKIITSQVRFTLPFSHKLIAKDKTLLPGNSLTLCFAISVTTDVSTNRRENPSGMSPLESSFEADMEKLFNNPKFSDVTIAVGDRKFSALKAILAARSSVFASIFEQDENEEENSIEITDLTGDVFEEVLYFIYTDRVRSLEAMRDDLLFAGWKYDLRRLVQLTGHALLKDLTTENVAERLLLAHRYQLEGVKNSVIRFIKGQVKAVVQTEGYRTLTEANCSLALEIFQTMALE